MPNRLKKALQAISPDPWPDRWIVEIDGTRAKLEGNDSWATKAASFAALHRWLRDSYNESARPNLWHELRMQWIEAHVAVRPLPALAEARRILHDALRGSSQPAERLALRATINSLDEVTGS